MLCVCACYIHNAKRIPNGKHFSFMISMFLPLLLFSYKFAHLIDQVIHIFQLFEQYYPTISL